MEKENKEMDLFDLMSKIVLMCKNGFVAFGKGILWILRFNIKNWLVMLLFLFAGIFLAFYSRMPQNRKYYAEFRMQINGTTSYTVHDIIKALSRSINEEDNLAFADSIHLKPEIAKSVKKLESFYIIDLNNNHTPDFVDYKNVFKEDSLNIRMKNFLCVRFKTKGITDFNQLQKSLIEYLRSNKYLQKEEQERIKVIKYRMEALSYEIIVLDSLRRNEKSKNDYSLTIVERARSISKNNTSEEMLKLKNELSNLQEELDLQHGVVTVYSRAITKVVRTDVFIFCTRIIGLYLLGFILALFITYRKRIQKILKEE